MTLKLIFSRLLILLINLIWLLDFIASASMETARKDTLKLVQVIFRHGDRAPTKSYPNDPHNNEFDKLWPEGFAQLTNRGKMQQYELGQFLRQRYEGYLAKKYSQKELYVTSSDMDRTIMSLESNLAGLFPPVINPWNPNIDWQPIPLRTIPRKEDKYLHNNVKCPKYSELRSEFYSSSEVVAKMNKEHQDFIKYCAKHSGLNITTVKGLYPLLDVLYAQASHNYTLPDWVTKNNALQKLLELTGVVNTWPTYTDEMKRLWGGPFLHLLQKNMQAISGHLGGVGASEDDEVIHSVHHGKNRKMIMYSAHDSTLERIMNTMGIFDPHCPPYASALMIELHQDQRSLDYYIEIHYRNDTTREPFLLTPPQCSHPCRFETYLQITQHLIPVNWKQECQLNAELEDDEEEFKPTLNFLKNDSSANADSKPTEECFLSSSQLLLLGFGLIIMSNLSALVIIKVLQYRSENGGFENDYVCSSGRPNLVELYSCRPIHRSRHYYEQL